MTVRRRGSRMRPRARARTCDRGSRCTRWPRARTDRGGRRAALNAAQRRTCSTVSSSHSGSPARRPVFTTSARPFCSSSPGSVSRSVGVDDRGRAASGTRRRGSSLRKIDPDLPADRSVHLPDERRRHRDPVDPAQVAWRRRSRRRPSSCHRRARRASSRGRAGAPRQRRSASACASSHPRSGWPEHRGARRRVHPRRARIAARVTRVARSGSPAAARSTPSRSRAVASAASYSVRRSS